MPRVPTSRVATPPPAARTDRAVVDLAKKTSRSGALIKSGEVFTAKLPAGTWNIHANKGKQMVEYRLPGERNFRKLDQWGHGLKGTVEFRVTGSRGLDKPAQVIFRTEPGRGDNRGDIKTFDFDFVVRGPGSVGARADAPSSATGSTGWRPSSTGRRTSVGGDDSGARPGRAVGGRGSSPSPTRGSTGRRSIGGDGSATTPTPRRSIGGSGSGRSSYDGGSSWSSGIGGGGS